MFMSMNFIVKNCFKNLSEEELQEKVEKINDATQDVLNSDYTTTKHIKELSQNKSIKKAVKYWCKKHTEDSTEADIKFNELGDEIYVMKKSEAFKINMKARLHNLKTLVKGYSKKDLKAYEKELEETMENNNKFFETYSEKVECHVSMLKQDVISQAENAKTTEDYVQYKLAKKAAKEVLKKYVKSVNKAEGGKVFNVSQVMKALKVDCKVKRNLNVVKLSK